MKRLLPLIVVFLAACATEEKVGPSQAKTFVRYFNGGHEDDAQAVLESADGGFVILANTTFQASEQALPYYRIKLIKTDAYGNQEWQKFYPEFPAEGQTLTKSYKGNGIISTEGGYVIAGEDIDPVTNSPRLMAITIDSQGENAKFKTIRTTGAVRGVGAAINSKGNFMILGSIPNPPDDKNMGLVEFSKSTLDSVWSTTYGAGKVALANRLFLDPSDNAFWGGTVQKDNSNPAIRFVKIVTGPSNPGGIAFDLPISNPLFKETGNDFCKYGSGFAVIGSTNKKAGGTTGDFDIVFKRISADGVELSSQSFPLEGQEQNEAGNSITTTRDGGLLLLGTVDSQGDFGRGDKDYYLIKIDAFGAVSWTQVYGSKFADVGVNVMQASDGGYVVLGTSELGKLSTIMLMKTDKNGKIE